MYSVVDENVLVVANDISRTSLGLEPLCLEKGEECRLACAEFLYQLVRNGKVILDDGCEYFDKYRSHCSLSGQPGIGDAFLRAVYDRGYTDWCRRVEICDSGGYKLPKRIIDSKFDRDDLLWLAGVYNSDQSAQVCNASDSDYVEHADLLTEVGIAVRQVC